MRNTLHGIPPLLLILIIILGCVDTIDPNLSVMSQRHMEVKKIWMRSISEDLDLGFELEKWDSRALACGAFTASPLPVKLSDILCKELNVCFVLQGFLGKVVSMSDQAIKWPRLRLHVNLLGLPGLIVVRFIYLKGCLACLYLCIMCMQCLWWPGDVV